jgi:hypothetical protein
MTNVVDDVGADAEQRIVEAVRRHGWYRACEVLQAEGMLGATRGRVRRVVIESCGFAAAGQLCGRYDGLPRQLMLTPDEITLIRNTVINCGFRSAPGILREKGLDVSDRVIRCVVRATGGSPRKLGEQITKTPCRSFSPEEVKLILEAVAYSGRKKAHLWLRRRGLTVSYALVRRVVREHAEQRG